MFSVPRPDLLISDLGFVNLNRRAQSL